MEINKDDDILINAFLNGTLLKTFENDQRVELVVRPNCNQKCQYCYLTKYGNKIYPTEYNVSNEQILNNIKLFFDYLIEKKAYVCHWEIFAGDLFYDGLYFEIIDLFIEYFKKILDIFPGNQEIGDISIPCNFSFINNEDTVKKFDEYYNKLLDIRVHLSLSCSTDGPNMNVREKINPDYDKLFTFIKKYNFGIHPMISYETIDNAIENYDWWVQQFEKYHFNPSRKDRHPCMLEVRNEGWTDEAIDKYIKLLDHIIEDRIKACYNNIDTFAISLFAKEEFLKYHSMLIYAYGPHQMDPIKLIDNPNRDNHMTCSMGGILTVNCADLTLVPCHRLAYPHFRGAQFVIENNKIIKVKALNGLYAFLSQILENVKVKPICVNCENKQFCIQGCNGAQYEAFGEPFLPIPEVCKMLSSKINFLVEKYEKLGIFHFIFNNSDLQASPEHPDLTLLNSEYKNNLINLLIDKGYPEYEKYR